MSARHHEAPATTAAPARSVWRGPQATASAPFAEPGLANRMAGLPYWAKNRTQRVLDRACAACGGLVFRAPRGPAPRHCVRCELGRRRRQQLRAYLCAAERLARTLKRADVAEATHAAVVTLDADARP